MIAMMWDMRCAGIDERGELCDRKLAVISRDASGEFRVVCPRCGTLNRAPLDNVMRRAILSTQLDRTGTVTAP